MIKSVYFIALVAFAPFAQGYLVHAGTLERSCELYLLKAAIKNSKPNFDRFEKNFSKEYLQKIKDQFEKESRQSLESYGMNLADELLRRERQGDSHVKWLRYLGVVLSDRKSLEPKIKYVLTPGEIMVRANAYVQELIKSGKVNSEKAIFFAVPFS